MNAAEPISLNTNERRESVAQNTKKSQLTQTLNTKERRESVTQNTTEIQLLQTLKGESRLL